MKNYKSRNWHRLPWQGFSCAAVLLMGISAATAQTSTLAPRRAAIGTATNSSPSTVGTTDTLPWKQPGGTAAPATTFNGGTGGGAAMPWNNPAASTPWTNPRMADNRSSTFSTGGSGAGPSPQANPNAGYAAATGPELKVTKGNGSLPNDAGQIWREYDISPYTDKLRGKPKPEQAIIDWIIRETGQEIWFSQPLGILNADNKTLRVYHTAEVQNVVRDVVERFVRGQAEGHAFEVRIITLNGPAWRTKAFPMMRPVDVQSAGVEAWLLSRENATMLLADMRNRSDFRELNTPNSLLISGQAETISRTRPRSFTRNVRTITTYPGYELVPAQLDEGFGLLVNPMLSLDGTTCDAGIKCHIDQLEKLVPLNMDVTTMGGIQRVQIQVPQLVSWRMDERFRWPTDQVLLLSCGIVANPANVRPGALSALNPFDADGTRADALMMITYRGRANAQGNVVPTYAGVPGNSPSAGGFTQPAPSTAPSVRTATNPAPYTPIGIPAPSTYNRGRY